MPRIRTYSVSSATSGRHGTSAQQHPLSIDGDGLVLFTEREGDRPEWSGGILYGGEVVGLSVVVEQQRPLAKLRRANLNVTAPSSIRLVSGPLGAGLR